jgi:hypothetical protein
MTLSSIRKGIISKITGNTGVQAKLGNPARLYTKGHVPSNPTMPYATIRLNTDTAWNTIGRLGNNTTFTIDVIGEQLTDDIVEDAGDAIRTAVDRQAITATGTSVVMITYETGGMVPDDDPNVQHFTSIYRVKSTPAS